MASLDRESIEQLARDALVFFLLDWWRLSRLMARQ